MWVKQKGLAFALLLVFTGVASPLPAQTTKVTFIQPSLCFCAAPIYAADALGYFKSEGLDVEIETIQGSSPMFAAINNGDAQFGLTNGLTLLSVIPKGLALTAIVGMDRGVGGYNMVVSNAFAQQHGIKPSSDWRDVMRKLVGARIGVLGVVTTGALIFTSAARQLGIAPDSYRLIGMLGAASIPALANGEIDAWFQAQPAAGGVPAFRSADLPHFKAVVGNVIFASRSYLTQNPDMAAKFARAVARGNNAILDPKLQDKALEALYARMPSIARDEIKAEVLVVQPRAANGSLIPAAFDLTNDVDAQLGLLPAPLTSAQLHSAYTMQFVPKVYVKP